MFLARTALNIFFFTALLLLWELIMLPINWRLSSDEICFNLNDCAPVMLFVDAEYQDLITGIQDKLLSVKKYYNLKPPGGSYNDFESLSDNSGDLTPVPVSADDGYVIIHTAAVKGRPRGALLSHGNVLFADMHWNCCLQITHEDVHLNLLPLFHVGGLFMATNSFHAGALNINMSKFDARKGGGAY